MTTTPQRFGRLTPEQQAKYRLVMGEFAAGTLKSSNGAKVVTRRQAEAIAFSEARKLLEPKAAPR